MAAVSVIFGLSLFIMPVLLYQLPLSQWMAERKLSMYLLIETGLLLLLLLVCDITSGEAGSLPQRWEFFWDWELSFCR